MKREFLAFFYDKFSDDERLWLYETKRINFNALKERKSEVSQKPNNSFGYKGCMYIWNPEAVTSYDKKGRPIIKYRYGLSLPFVDDTNSDLLKTNGVLLHESLVRGEMKAVIASSQKPKQEWDLKTLIIGALMGAGVMFILITVFHL